MIDRRHEDEGSARSRMANVLVRYQPDTFVAEGAMGRTERSEIETYRREKERKSNVNSCVDIRNGSQLQETRRNEWAHEIKNTLHEREYFGFVSYVAAAILCLSHSSTILAGEIVPAR